MNNGQKPAYPITSDRVLKAEGLTKREYFAGQAMVAFLTGVINVGGDNSYPTVARASVGYADALLKELEKPQS